MPIHIPVQKLGDHDTSDGYHTFAELYEFRKMYNAALFNELARQGKYDIHKSWLHHDGEPPFGKHDMFIVVAQLPTGQISNHYKGRDWDLFECEQRKRAAEWDGHTPEDVTKRIRDYIFFYHAEWSVIDVKGQPRYRRNKKFVPANAIPDDIKSRILTEAGL